MCQLLGMNSRLPASLTLSFTGFARRGGATDHHADGWGIAFFESEGEKPGRGVRLFVDKESAATSPLAHMLRSFPIKSHNVIAHVRKATMGGITLENAHPFVRELWGRYWVFAHNGPLDRLAIVVTEPLTTNEAWTALEPGQFITFIEGCPQPRATMPRVPQHG